MSILNNATHLHWINDISQLCDCVELQFSLHFNLVREQFKVPLLWVMKVHILVLGVTNNRLTCMQGQKHLFYYNMHLFLPYLLNDSQTIHSTIHFSKPLLCVTLLCSDWSISFKAEHSVTLCTVLPGKQIQKWHLVATSGRGIC